MSRENLSSHIPMTTKKCTNKKQLWILEIFKAVQCLKISGTSKNQLYNGKEDKKKLLEKTVRLRGVWFCARSGLDPIQIGKVTILNGKFCEA